MSAIEQGHTIEDRLVGEQTAPLHELYNRAGHFLREDWDNLQRLAFARGLGVASFGHEIGDAFYRLTDCYSLERGNVWVPGLVAVERVADEATVELNGKYILADNRSAERLWRLRPARTAYVLNGSDSVIPAAIEDLTQTELKVDKAPRYSRGSGISTPEHGLPSENFAAELEGEALEHARQIISQLLTKLEVGVK